MTVVPADQSMTLICDGCGDTITGTACVLPDAEVVWTLVLENGWAGSPFASGPHHCPRCGLALRADDDTAEGDRRTDRGRTQALGIDDLDEVGHEPPGGEAEPVELVRRALREAIDLGGRLLVDLTDVEVIDSAGLGLLVRAHQEARRRGGALCLVAPSRFVLTVLHTMRLDGVFPIVMSRAAALRGLARLTAETTATRAAPHGRP
ncbi:STAS domain-containing protein [Micromonospora sp. WMMD812]|uniref:STAS domain-containing protein n=1 Tax=Micromonospora sp. WMMD812 TaxID=3015152 RepID=UPI00248CF7AE|nr:STAS domain-containing protein [Micromonospora sp. WMMD812]WBB68469.1 STAS domain-containing protein [Micromonospora sp. WMMD812]